ncbi:MAG: 3-dehydroquinate synthase [Phycisphaeraceae bacterium]|nr:3-dehydroquinate synthase [Phycisphaeraceae bacterium]
MRLDRSIEVRFDHRLIVTRGVFDSDAAGADALAAVIREGMAVGGSGGELKSESDRRAKVLFCIDTHVAKAHPDLVDRIHAWERRHAELIEPAGRVHPVPGGEFCKNNREILYALLSRIHHQGLDRQSYIVVIGGGAVLDCVGMAAALAHRGVRLIRMPTTTLAQGDSGVGVKNAINGFEQKNYLGTFAVPWAVIHDEAFLDSLSPEAWRDGFSEAVKVALLKDATLLERLELDADRIRRVGDPAGLDVLRRSAVLHMDHIALGGDPFEMTSARPLDFGHWAAHRIEALTDYRISHGHAVAIGLMIDLEYGRRAGLTEPDCARRGAAVLRNLGFSAPTDLCIPSRRLLEGIEHFRAHLGGALTLTMVQSPGRAVNIHEVDMPAMLGALDTVLPRQRVGSARST